MPTSRRCCGTGASGGRICTGSATRTSDGPRRPAEHEPFHTLNDHGMLDLEPPDHTRIRRLVSKAFTPRTVEQLRPYVTGLAADLVDRLVEKGGGDLLTRRRRAAPRRRHRRDAGHPGVGSGPAAALVGGHLRDVRAEPAAGDGAEGGAGLGRVLGVSAGADRRAAQGAGRGPHLRADRRPRRGGPPHRAGDDLDLRAAPERRSRGHRELHRQRLVRPLPRPRPARGPARRPLPRPVRRRRADALRHPAPALRTLGPGRHRDRRDDDPAGRGDRHALRLGQP